MTVGQYTVISGSAGSEQSVISRLDEFLTGALGWSRLGVITNSGADNDRVWYSEGEVSGKYNPLYVRVRGNNNDLIFYGYTLWSGSGNDEISNTIELQIPYLDASDEYIFIGNKDAFFISSRLNSDGANYVGGAGYFNTFYTPTEDPYPLFVSGQNSSGDTFANTLRVRAYGFDPDGFLHTGSTISGGSIGYVALDLSSLMGLATPNPRDGRHLMMKQNFYRKRSDTEGDIIGAISHEIRGELPAMYQFYGSNFAPNDRITASGVSTGDAIPGNEVGEGDFIVARSTTSNAYTLGPVVNYAPVPKSVSDLELWLRADAVERVGGNSSGGRVREWIDLSGKVRHATQSVVIDRPVPLVSGTDSNSQAIVQFNNSDYLTGTLEVVDGYTLFVVAKYLDGVSRDPLLYIRGSVGGADTIIGLEFNPVTSNSVDMLVRSDDTPLEEDIERYTGLISDTFYVLSAVVSGTSNGTSLYVNGDAKDTTTISNTKTSIAGSTTLNFGVGTSLDSSGSSAGEARHQGDIAEVLAYTRALTDSEHQSIICYLGGKYAIAVSGTC